jgi:hypothetical protein
MESPQKRGPEAETFDLSKSTSEYRESRAGARALGTAMFVIGLSFVAYIAYLLLSRAGSSSIAWQESGGIMLTVGVVVAAVSWPLATEAWRYPTSLLVSKSRLEFRRGSDEITNGLSWDSPRFKVELLDRSGLPAIRRDGRPRVRFSLQIRRSSWIPIPAEAFELILSHAATRGLSVSRKTIPVPGSGTYEDIVIRRARR